MNKLSVRQTYYRNPQYVAMGSLVSLYIPKVIAPDVFGEGRVLPLIVRLLSGVAIPTILVGARKISPRQGSAWTLGAAGAAFTAFAIETGALPSPFTKR